MSDAAAPPTFDAARLIADMRKGDPIAIEEAYTRTFGNNLGRLVLAHHLAVCGVGNKIGGLGVSPGDLAYAVGRHDAAIELALAAHFDQAAVVAALASETLEGNDDADPAYNFVPGDDYDGY